MPKDVVSPNYETKVKKVCKIMGERRIDGVIVTQYGKSAGIFTERDLFSKVLLKSSLDNEVGEYVLSPLILVSSNYDVRKSARIMADVKIRILVVWRDPGNYSCKTFQECSERDLK